MENFSNQPINTNELPQFQEVSLLKPQSKYLNIILINISLVSVALIGGIFLFLYMKPDVFSQRGEVILGTLTFVFLGFLYIIYSLEFSKRGYCFREKDVIYKEGFISQTTTLVPFNRVQHVALHQGLFSRYFGLASLELFTAGGSSSDLKITGLLLADAQNFKELIIQKISTAESITETEQPTEILTKNIESND